MRKFHNPMTIVLLICIAVCFIGFICFTLFSEYDIPTPVYFGVSILFVLLLFVCIKGERIFKKSDSKVDAEYNTAQTVKAQFNKNAFIAIITVIIVIAVIFGFTALIIYNATIGVPIFIAALLILFFGVLYKTRNMTVEKYVMSTNRRSKPLLFKIHEAIYEEAPTCVCGMHPQFHFPHYVLPVSGNRFYNIISVQAIIGGKNIRIYPQNPEVFTVFAERINEYKNDSKSELLLPTNKPIDYQLIKEIVRFNIDKTQKKV